MATFKSDFVVNNDDLIVTAGFKKNECKFLRCVELSKRNAKLVFRQKCFVEFIPYVNAVLKNVNDEERENLPFCDFITMGEFCDCNQLFHVEGHLRPIRVTNLKEEKNFFLTASDCRFLEEKAELLNDHLDGLPTEKMMEQKLKRLINSTFNDINKLVKYEFRTWLAQNTNSPLSEGRFKEELSHHFKIKKMRFRRDLVSIHLLNKFEEYIGKMVRSHVLQQKEKDELFKNFLQENHESPSRLQLFRKFEHYKRGYTPPQ